MIKILTREEEELIFKAKMTQIQFYALALKLQKSKILQELTLLKYFNEFKRSSTCDIKEVKKWIVNGWNTEYLLRINFKTLKGDALRNSLHWSFPQAYYSVYTICLAFFKVAGFTESSHTSVISKVGKLMYEGKYPNVISFLSDGGMKKISFTNINRVELPSTIYFAKTPEVIDTHICQFLKSTREMDLDDRKVNIKCYTVKGKRKVNFSELDWEKVSHNLGYTSIMSLLYRKRIKSNYRDIETFLCEELNVDEVYKYLIAITSSINIVHESFIMKGLGETQYISLYQKLNDEIKEIIFKRSSAISKIIA
ncbi:MAG: hypothetical protein JEY94_00975 [Melioribacteraceae bacterium]|nr:hypothetical protein [Melioribacteraceae bacterium]